MQAHSHAETNPQPERRRKGAHRVRRSGLARLGFFASRVLIALVILASIVIAGIVVGPRFLPYQALIVRSGSMSPTIPTGSVAFYRPEPASQVRVGQIILFSEPGDDTIHITHRVVKIVSGPAGRYFVTKGDANATDDEWRVPAVGTGWIVVYHVPYLGYALADLSGNLGRWLLLSVPAFGLAIVLLLELVRPKRAPPEPEPA